MPPNPLKGAFVISLILLLPVLFDFYFFCFQLLCFFSASVVSLTCTFCNSILLLITKIYKVHLFSNQKLSFQNSQKSNFCFVLLSPSILHSLLLVLSHSG